MTSQSSSIWLSPSAKFSLRGIAADITRLAWELVEGNASSHRAIVSVTAQLALRDLLRERLVHSASRIAALFDHDVRWSKPAWRENLLRHYPGLYDLWQANIRDWSDFVGRFLRQSADFRLAGSDEGEPYAIRRLWTDFSDPHHGGRCVIKVQFQDRDPWFYKPRDGTREAAWGDFLRTVNSAGFQPAFFIPHLVCKRSHCWMNSLSARPCRSEGARQRFHQRAGALLYLSHMFRAVDLHRDNFVAHGEHPILVDCETFFHPDTRLPADICLDETSIHRTGMLSSASRFLLPVGSRQSVRDEQRRNVIQGFESMHRFWRAAGRTRSLRSAIKDLRGAVSRHIFRPTILYRDLLERSLEAKILSATSSRAEFFRSNLDDGLCSARIVKREIEQLMRGDIPIFHGRPAYARRPLTPAHFSCAVAALHSRWHA